MSQDLKAIQKEMDVLLQNFVNCRAHFPSVPDTMIGENAAKTAPFYVKQGFEIYFSFGEPLTKEIINTINDIGHWINQNFVVRLYALLNSHCLVSDKNSIDFNIDGSFDVDLIRRLRHYFAHSSGKYNPMNPNHKMTLEKMGEYLDIEIQRNQDFPLTIDTVLQPLFNGCKRYVEAKLKVA